MDIIKVILTSLLSAGVLFVTAKIMGHKQISHLDIFDYVTAITIGSIAAELATEIENPLKPLIAILVYGFISVALSILTGKIPKLRKYVNGTPTILMNEGKLYRKNMKKARLDLSEFMVMLRQQGYFNLNDIQTAIFEYNGKLTILPVSYKRPLNPEDMKLTPPKEHILTEIIMDGKTLHNNLKRKGLDMSWLNKELQRQGYKSPKEIFLGLCDDKNTLILYAME